MAKISARGATKLAEYRRTFHTTDGRALTSVIVLCSDGRILRRLIHSDGTPDGYTVAATIKVEDKLRVFNRYASRRGYPVAA